MSILFIRISKIEVSLRSGDSQLSDRQTSSTHILHGYLACYNFANFLTNKGHATILAPGSVEAQQALTARFTKLATN